jgi:hypothetical protein
MTTGRINQVAFLLDVDTVMHPIGQVRRTPHCARQSVVLATDRRTGKQPDSHHVFRIPKPREIPLTTQAAQKPPAGFTGHTDRLPTTDSKIDRRAKAAARH